MLKKRIQSNLIDLFIYILITIVISSIYSHNPNWIKFSLFTFSICFLYVLYELFFNFLSRGQTIGRLISGIQVKNDGSSSIPKSQYIKRNHPLIIFQFLGFSLILSSVIVDFGVYNYSFTGDVSGIKANTINPDIINIAIILTWIAPAIWMIIDIVTAYLNNEQISLQDRISETRIENI